MIKFSPLRCVVCSLYVSSYIVVGFSATGQCYCENCAKKTPVKIIIWFK